MKSLIKPMIGAFVVFMINLAQGAREREVIPGLKQFVRMSVQQCFQNSSYTMPILQRALSERIMNTVESFYQAITCENFVASFYLTLLQSDTLLSPFFDESEAAQDWIDCVEYLLKKEIMAVSIIRYAPDVKVSHLPNLSTQLLPERTAYEIAHFVVGLLEESVQTIIHEAFLEANKIASNNFFG